MDNLQSLFKKVQLDAKSAGIFYVYYTPSTGNIHKISPRLQSSEYDILEITEQEAKPILNGEKKSSDFRVVYNFASKKIVFEEKKEQNIFGNYEYVLYKIPQVLTDSDFTIIKSNQESRWIISVSQETKNFINQKSLAILDNVLLHITKKDDPNILYRNICVELKKITKQDVYIPFESEYETSCKDLSIYTNKYFNTYSWSYDEQIQSY